MSHEPTRLEMPVRSVMLTQDRGRVMHRASMEWSGEGSLLLVGLSPQLVDISLQVRCTPGRVGRVEVIRSYEAVESVESPAAAREVLEDESRRLVRREERLGQDLERTRAGREVLMAHIAAAAVRGEGAVRRMPR